MSIKKFNIKEISLNDVSIKMYQLSIIRGKDIVYYYFDDYKINNNNITVKLYTEEYIIGIVPIEEKDFLNAFSKLGENNSEEKDQTVTATMIKDKSGEMKYVDEKYILKKHNITLIHNHAIYFNDLQDTAHGVLAEDTNYMIRNVGKHKSISIKEIENNLRDLKQFLQNKIEL